MMAKDQDRKERAIRIATALQPELLALARRLHDAPELSGEEEESARQVSALLASHGFAVEFETGGLPTAFVARRHLGSAGPVVAYLAEYDALPDIGHGCGHNLIAAAAVGAGVSVAETMADRPGEVRVIGTPAEETLGGKVILV
ncbi:MAG: M20 family peptidase, partial [Acidobacteriota bacterium]